KTKVFTIGFKLQLKSNRNQCDRREGCCQIFECGTKKIRKIYVESRHRKTNKKCNQWWKSKHFLQHRIIVVFLAGKQRGNHYAYGRKHYKCSGQVNDNQCFESLVAIQCLNNGNTDKRGVSESCRNN